MINKEIREGTWIFDDEIDAWVQVFEVKKESIIVNNSYSFYEMILYNKIKYCNVDLLNRDNYKGHPILKKGKY